MHRTAVVSVKWRDAYAYSPPRGRAFVDGERPGAAGQVRRSQIPSMTLWSFGVAVGFSTTRPVKAKVGATIPGRGEVRCPGIAAVLNVATT
jgi:hypothetical protein